jgi:hypothetical protein
MIAIKFVDQEAQKRALGFLLGRFSGRVLRGGVLIVPEPALVALAEENFSFTVMGRATYDQMASFRTNADAAIQ